MTEPTPPEETQPVDTTQEPESGQRHGFTVTEARLWAEEELTEEREVRRRRARASIARSEAEERERQRQQGIDARTQAGAALVSYRVGSREYPYKTAPGCKVCHSPWRATIESQLASGRTCAQVARELPEQARLGYANLYTHKQRHLPPGLATTVALIEKRAEERGLSIEHGTQLLTDEVTLARLTVQRTTERLVAGEVEPTLAEGLAAGKWLGTIGDNGNAAMDEQAYTQSMIRFFQITRASMSPDQWQDFLLAVRDDPILSAINGRETQSELEAEDDIQEAEVIVG